MRWGPSRRSGRRSASRISTRKTAVEKQPNAITLAKRGLMALAGLWETWRSPAGERVRSFAIMTTTPNELRAELHDQMQVFVRRQVFAGMAGREAFRAAKCGFSWRSTCTVPWPYAVAAASWGCPEPTPGLKRGISSDGQVGDEYLAFGLRAQQHRDKEDGQAHHRGDENRTR